MNTRKTTLIVAGGFVLAALPSVFAGSTGAKFKQMDTDSDGHISREEHAAVALAAFDKLDANRDGVVTATELAGNQEPRAGKPRSTETKSAGTSLLPPTSPLSRADQNGDGQITRAEQQADADLVFVAIDSNKDGVINESELEAAPTPIKARNPEQPAEMPGRRS
jgi:Ca2+-binding EF-hand superfamily protein